LSLWKLFSVKLCTLFGVSPAASGCETAAGWILEMAASAARIKPGPCRHILHATEFGYIVSDSMSTCYTCGQPLEVSKVFRCGECHRQEIAKLTERPARCQATFKRCSRPDTRRQGDLVVSLHQFVNTRGVRRIACKALRHLICKVTVFGSGSLLSFTRR
jgi:hypothetical protein